MLPSKLRLKGKKYFSEVRKSGILCQGKFVGLSKIKVQDEATRIGVIVSTKISKKAVTRNKIRRSIYSVAAEVYKALPHGYNIVIMAKRNCADAETFEIMEDTRKLFYRCFQK